MEVPRTNPECDLLTEVQRLIETGQVGPLATFLDRLPPGEVPRLLGLLSDAERGWLLERLAPEAAAGLVWEIPDVQAVDLLEDLAPERAAAILSELPPNEQADLLGDLDPGGAEAILDAMEPEAAREVRTLGRYPDDVAGGLMVKELLAYRQDLTVLEVIEDIRRNADHYRGYMVQYAFVTGPEGRLVGVLRLRDLLLAPHSQPIGTLMVRDPLTVRDTATLDALRGFFDRHPFFGVPVVDDAGRLVGIVQRAGVEEALADRSDSDYLKSQGIVGGEELRTLPLLLRSRRRLSWLSVNIVLNVLAASVIAAYQDTLSAVIALAVFLPIISDMSGCSGNQAVAVSMRELTLGLIRPTETARVWTKEISIGLLNGVVLGALIAGVAWIWKGNPVLGMVVGLAMAGNTVIAVSIGGTVPLILRRMDLDPALASGPILTTITDMCGFFLLLSLATVFLPWIAA